MKTGMDETARIQMKTVRVRAETVGGSAGSAQERPLRGRSGRPGWLAGPRGGGADMKVWGVHGPQEE